MGSGGADVKANLGGIRERYTIPVGGVAEIGTGIKVAVPQGFELQIRSRSGLAWHSGVTVLNSPGTIDSDYRGEVCVLLKNDGEQAYTVRHGDRVAQMILA